jgi:hypothetical protein
MSFCRWGRIGGLWLGKRDGGEGERRRGGWLACLVRHAAASLLLLFLHKICMHLLFLLPNTTRQRGEGIATV